MPYTTPWTDLLFKSVQGGPVPYDEIHEAMAALVPPGRAFRDNTRVRDWRSPNAVSRDDRLMTASEKAFRIRQGKRRVAASAIWTSIRSGRIERYEENGVVFLREGSVPPGKPRPERASGKRKPPNLLVPKVREFLSDGEWVSYAALVEALVPYLPRHLAVGRLKSWNIKREKDRIGPPDLARRFTDEERMAAAYRSKVASVLAYMNKTGRIEVSERFGQKVVRRGPTFWKE